MANLLPPKAPNLLIAPPAEYEARYQDQLNNAQRLYYNQIDSVTQSLLGPNGGQFLNIPHIAASDDTDQYATGNNTPTVVKWSTLDSGSGWTLNAPGSATPDQTGVYKITYSLQLVNNNTASEHTAVVWLRVDGDDVPNSGTLFTLAKAASANTYICAYSEVVFTITAESVVELVWATDKAATSGGTKGIFIEAIAAQTSPYIRPAIPSALGSITFVSSV